MQARCLRPLMQTRCLRSLIPVCSDAAPILLFVNRLCRFLLKGAIAGELPERIDWHFWSMELLIFMPCAKRFVAPAKRFLWSGGTSETTQPCVVKSNRHKRTSLLNY